MPTNTLEAFAQLFLHMLRAMPFSCSFGRKVCRMETEWLNKFGEHVVQAELSKKNAAALGWLAKLRMWHTCHLFAICNMNSYSQILAESIIERCISKTHHFNTWMNSLSLTWQEPCWHRMACPSRSPSPCWSIQMKMGNAQNECETSPRLSLFHQFLV